MLVLVKKKVPPWLGGLGGWGGEANEIESKQREENTKYESMRREINKNQKQGVGICFCF